MKILSFIIPAYNSEKFLDKVIPSMLVPEVMDKLEIIVVNDGSLDKTEEITKGYCVKYPETVRLISQENKGHGGALNTGCAAATGKYLKVIDADDWVVSENLPAFVALLEKCESDVVLTHFHTVDISTQEIRPWKSYPSAFNKVYSMEEIMENWNDFSRVFALHGICYKTSFYEKCNIRLCEHVFYEDYQFASCPCCYAESVTPFDLFIYEYRIGDVNQSVSDASKLKRVGHIEKVLDQLIIESRRAEKIAYGGKAYLAVKAQELLLSYFTTVLLSEPDKKKGREQAKLFMLRYEEEFPEAAGRARNKYKVFQLLNRLHVSKAQWEALMRSKIYRKLRRDHSFT